jgi:KUP system potassium uptake protein
MTMTTVLFFEVMRPRWGLWWSLTVALLFSAIDLAFFSANLHKISSGGWLPLTIGLVLFTLFSTWKRGRQVLSEHLSKSAVPLEPLLDDLRAGTLTRVPGTAVFMSSSADKVPFCLLHHVKHNKSLHERIVLLSITTEHTPWIRRRDRVAWRDLGAGVHQVVAHFGFMQSPHMPDILRQFRRLAGFDIELGNTSFFLGRETLLATGRSGMWRWRAALFAFLSRNSHTATEFFGLPPGRVVELGMQIEI